MNKYKILPNIDKYVHISELGKGSYGTVSLVRNTLDNKLYANKKITLNTRTIYEKKQIMNETKILSCHSSKYIIALQDAYINNGSLNLIMEYAKKGDLSKIIGQYKKNRFYIQESVIKKYLYQICKGVEFLHRNNIIHRDLKCANIFLTEDNNIKIGDMGIIKVLNKSKFTNTNIGTPYYMSPEVYNNKKYSFKTDIWSIGVVLYELMTFKLPYDAINLKQLKHRVISSNWYLDSKYRSRFSKPLIDLLGHILEHDENKRYTIYDILTHSYFDEYNSSITNVSLSSKFYIKSAIPYSMMEWTTFVNKYVQVDKPDTSVVTNKNDICEVENILTQVELLMHYVSTSKFTKYYNLKQIIKKQISSIKNNRCLT